MPSEGYPQPDKDSKIPKEVEKEIDDILGSLHPKSSDYGELPPDIDQSRLEELRPKEYLSFHTGSIEDMVCRVIIDQYGDTIFLKPRELESWEKDPNTGNQYQIPGPSNERYLLNTILADRVVIFLKMRILDEYARTFGYQLEREGILKKNSTRTLHELFLESGGIITPAIEDEQTSIIEDLIDRIIAEQ